MKKSKLIIIEIRNYYVYRTIYIFGVNPAANTVGVLIAVTLWKYN